MTNIIFKVTIPGKQCQPLLFRAYGNCRKLFDGSDCVGTDIFLDREKEVKNFEILSDNNFGIHLVKVFPGGRLEVWREGFEVSFTCFHCVNNYE